MMGLIFARMHSPKIFSIARGCMIEEQVCGAFHKLSYFQVHEDQQVEGDTSDVFEG